jgi:ParB-like chromosome segregation protein Spo0J
MATSVKWINDQFAEQAIKKFGVPFKVDEVEMTSINWEESKKNGARHTIPISSEHVTDLALAMANGDAIPRPVLRKVSGKYIIFGGNHRVPAARECGESSFSAYIIETTDEAVIFALPAALNAPAREQSREERIRLAMQSIAKGLTVADASSRFSLPLGIIHTQIRIDEFGKELSKIGIAPDKIAKTAILDLSAIKNPNVYAPAARLAIRAKLSSAECKTMSKDIRKEKTESQQIAVVAQYEKTVGLNPSAATVPVSAGKRLPITGIKIALSTIENHINVRSVNQWGVTEKGEKIDFIARLRKLCAGLEAICKRS